MKRSVILTDPLGPDILSAFWTKGQVLHRERAHLKVPGFSIVLNVLLTRKLPTFLSRLNEISGGCEKIALVSGSSYHSRGSHESYYFLEAILTVILFICRFILLQGNLIDLSEIKKEDNSLISYPDSFLHYICIRTGRSPVY